MVAAALLLRGLLLRRWLLLLLLLLLVLVAAALLLWGLLLRWWLLLLLPLLLVLVAAALLLWRLLLRWWLLLLLLLVLVAAAVRRRRLAALAFALALALLLLLVSRALAIRGSGPPEVGSDQSGGTDQQHPEHCDSAARADGLAKAALCDLGGGTARDVRGREVGSPWTELPLDESVSLTMTWSAPFGEDLKPGTPVTISGARLLLIENHQEDYQGPLLLEGRFAGVRIDTRTFRFPAEGTDPALDALLSERLSDGALTLSVSPTADTPSSIDEFTPSLAFGWRVAE